MNPSISTVPWTPPFPGGIGGFLVALDHAGAVGVGEQDVVELGEEPGGAGVPGSGSGPSKTSKSSRPFPSRNERSFGRRRSRSPRAPLRPDQAAKSAADAGPKALR